MNNKHIFRLFLIILSISFIGCKKTQDPNDFTEFKVSFLADNTIEIIIPVEIPGSLQTFISTDLMKRVSVLRIGGTINCDDLQSIRNIINYQEITMGNTILREVYLSGCNFEFASGGSFIYPKKTFLNVNGELQIHIDSIIVTPTDNHSIPPYAFASLNIKTISLSHEIQSIGDFAFAYNSINDFTLSPSVTEIGKGAFFSTHIQTEIEIPEGVVNLPDSVFLNAFDIPSIILPSTIKSIGSYCLKDCYHLNIIKIKAQSPPTCDQTMWDDHYTGMRSLYVPKGCGDAYRKHTVWGMADYIIEFNE